MVDNFQKQYESLKVPYPSDSVSATIEAQRGPMTQEIEKFKKESSARIAQAEKDIAHLKSLIPFGQMTMEDFAEAYPDQALDPINKPTFWPHDAEEQKPRVEPDHEGH
jgi:F-type H+-transporting ATPase subunit d